MKSLNRTLILLAIGLSLFIIVVSCSKGKAVSHNQITGYVFSQMFGSSEKNVLERIEDLKEVSDFTLFQEFTDEQQNEIKVYSMNETTGTFQYLVYLGFVKKNGSWIMNSCEKKGTGQAFSENGIQRLSEEYNRLCKTYGEPEYTEFDDKVFSDLLSSDRPVDRTANWPGSKGHPTAVFSIQIDEEGCSLYIMEREKD